MGAQRVLHFAGDPPYSALAALAKINDEFVIFYPQASLLAVVQPDNSCEVVRVD